MADQAARPARQRLGEARGRDGRGRGHQQRVRRGELVELGEDGLLVLDDLRPVLLDEFDVEQGFLQAGRDRDPRHRAIGIVAKAMARQRVQLVADQAGRRLQRRNMRIGEPHVPSGAREDRGPGAADQAGADDGDVAFSIGHFLLLTNLRLTARAPCGADRDRRATPSTAPGESPGRAPAPPWYRTAPAPDRDGDRR